MQLNRLKVFYITLCIFFVVGAFVTAYVNGQQVEGMPDRSWQTPEYFVGYFNNYLNQKVNPMTLGDVFVTEYIEHPEEPTGVIPLYPTQAVIQERSMVNCSFTEIETYLVPDDNNTYGTTVGIGLYVKQGDLGKWRLEKYDTISTASDGRQAIKVVIETPKLTFDAEGGIIRLVITNFGTEINEVVFVPTIIDTSERSSFSGMNTIVDAEDALSLTIKNKYQIVKGYRYYVDYRMEYGHQYYMYQLEPAGDVYKDENGYFRISKTDQGVWFWVRGKLFHRWMVEVKIGRELKHPEIVHHINGIKTDNRIDNLRLTTPEGHEEDHSYRENLIRRLPVVHKRMVEKGRL